MGKGKWFAGIAVVFAAIGAGVAYGVHRTNQVPDWYQAAEHTSLAVPESSKAILLSKFAAAAEAEGPVAIPLTEADVAELFETALESQGVNPPNEVQASIKGNRIESGVVVNLSDLPPGTLPAGAEGTVSQIIQTVPLLKNRDVYVGIDGSLNIERGKLKLGEDTVLKVGQMSFSLQNAAQQMGLSTFELENYLNTAISRQGIVLEDIQLDDGQLTLTGSLDNPPNYLSQ